MKKLKFLPFIFLLAVPALTGCGGDKYVETRSEEEVVNALGLQAMSEIGVAYAKFAYEGVNPGENTLITEINQKLWDGDQFGLNYTISYTLTAKENYDTPYLSLNEAGNVLTAQMVPSSAITAENYPTAASLGGAAYTLGAKMTFKGYAEGFVAPEGLTPSSEQVGKEVKKQNFNALSKIVKSGTIGEIKVAYDSSDKETKINSGDYVYTTGRVTAAYDWKYEEIFRGVVITDGSRGILLYAGCLQASFYDDANSPAKIKEGDIIAVYGQVSPYNGLFEVKPSMINLVTSDTEKAKIAAPTYREETYETFNKLKESDTGDLVKVQDLHLYDTVSTINKLKPGEHWVIRLANAENKTINTGLNYHIGEGQQEAIRNFIIEAKTSNKTFNFTGVITATNSKDELGAMMVGNKTSLQCYELNA